MLPACINPQLIICQAAVGEGARACSQPLRGLEERPPLSQDTSGALSSASHLPALPGRCPPLSRPNLAADSAPVTEPGRVPSRGAHTGIPPRAPAPLPAPARAPAGLPWRQSRTGFSPGTCGSTGSLQQPSWVLPPDPPCPRTNRTPGVPGLTGCLCRRPLRAEPPGAPQPEQGTPPHRERGSGKPRAGAKTPGPLPPPRN